MGQSESKNQQNINQASQQTFQQQQHQQQRRYQQHISSNNLASCFGCVYNENHESHLEHELNLGSQMRIPMGKLNNASKSKLTDDEIQFFNAASGKNVYAIRQYVQQGLNINILDEDRTSLLHVACRYGSIQIVEEIINKGGAINMTDIAGWTPLHVAVHFKRPFIVQLLLNHGADLDLNNQENKTPKDLVKDQKVLQVIQFYEQQQLYLQNHQQINGYEEQDYNQDVTDYDQYQHQYYMNMQYENNYDNNNYYSNPVQQNLNQVNDPYQNFMQNQDQDNDKKVLNMSVLSQNQQQIQNMQIINGSPSEQNPSFIRNRSFSSCNIEANNEQNKENFNPQPLNNENYETFNPQNGNNIQLDNQYNNKNQLFSPRRHNYYLYFKQLKQKYQNNQNQENVKIDNKMSTPKSPNFKGNLRPLTPNAMNVNQEILQCDNIDLKIQNSDMKKQPHIDSKYQDLMQFTDVQYTDENYILPQQYNKNSNNISNLQNQEYITNQDLSEQQLIEKLQQQQSLNFRINNLYKQQYNINQKGKNNNKSHHPSIQLKQQINQHSPSPSISSLYFINKKKIQLKDLIQIQTNNQNQDQDQQLNQKQNNINLKSQKPVSILNSSRNNINIDQNNNNFQKTQLFSLQLSDNSTLLIRHEDKIQQIKYLADIGVGLFNLNPILGLSFQQLFFQEAGIRGITNFLHKSDKTHFLQKSKYSLFQALTDISVKELKDIQLSFISKFKFKMSFTSAISHLDVENDPEKLDIILSSFAQNYYYRNTQENEEKQFHNADSCHMLAYATVLLDRDINLKKRTDKNNIINEFKLNILGINDGEDFKIEFINSVVENVLKQPLINFLSQEQVQEQQFKSIQEFNYIFNEFSQELNVEYLKDKKNQKNTNNKKLPKSNNNINKNRKYKFYILQGLIFLVQRDMQNQENQNKSGFIYIFDLQNYEINRNKIIFKSNNYNQKLVIFKGILNQGIQIQQKDQITIQLQQNIQTEIIQKLLENQQKIQENTQY